MPYTPDATVTTEPQDTQKASTAALEFRTLKTYIQSVVLPLIATKFGGSGGTMTGQILSTNATPLRVNNDTGKLDFYDSTGTALTGRLQFTAGGQISLQAQAGGTGVQLSAFGVVLQIDAGGAYPATGNPNLGKSSNRWGTVYAGAGNISGHLAVGGIISGDGSGLTNLPVAGLSAPAIVSALGYTPYNGSTNPNGYQNSSGSVANATTANTATLANKASSVSNYGGGANGNAMYLHYIAGGGSQPTWFLGTNDGINWYVWNPSNIVVNLAAQANVANQAASALAISSPGSNGYGNRTVSSSAPSGGSDGDIWYKV